MQDACRGRRWSAGAQWRAAPYVSAHVQKFSGRTPLTVKLRLPPRHSRGTPELPVLSAFDRGLSGGRGLDLDLLRDVLKGATEPFHSPWNSGRGYRSRSARRRSSMLDMYSRINMIQKSTKVFNGKMESPLGGKPNSEAVVHAKAIGVVLKHVIEAIGWLDLEDRATVGYVDQAVNHMAALYADRDLGAVRNLSDLRG